MDIPGLSHAAGAVGCPKGVRGDGAKIERRGEDEERGDEETNSAGWKSVTERFK